MKAGFIHAVRGTGRAARSALAFLGVSGRAVPTLIVMMVLFPVVASPVTVTIPIAVAMPARRHDDGGRRRRRDHDRRTHVDAYVDIGGVYRAGHADCNGSECQLCECLLLHGQSPKFQRVLGSDFTGQQKTHSKAGLLAGNNHAGFARILPTCCPKSGKVEIAQNVWNHRKPDWALVAGVGFGNKRHLVFLHSIAPRGRRPRVASPGVPLLVR